MRPTLILIAALIIIAAYAQDTQQGTPEPVLNNQQPSQVTVQPIAVDPIPI